MPKRLASRVVKPSTGKGTPTTPQVVRANPLTADERKYYNTIEKLGLAEKQHTGEEFSLTFVRASAKVIDNVQVAAAGDPWTIRCKFGVRPSGPPKSDPEVLRARAIANRTITVYQVGDDEGYRAIRLDSIVEVK